MNVPTSRAVSCFDLKRLERVAHQHTQVSDRPPTSIIDGCNTCSLQKEDPYFDGRMGCTYMYCETPKELKCLKYKTEKN